MAEPDSTNREKEIFEAAFDLAAGDERERYLDAACGSDKVLLARLRALLRADEAGQDFLAELPRETRTAITEKPGDRIGRYRLLQQIGEGGCGAVYMAEQTEPLQRRVALKVIKLGMDTRQVVSRFEAERQALALMDHPNIAKVLDAGATETGRPYFVMELVGGIRITDYCDENHLTTRQRLNLFIQVCRAVQHAHQKGIIHRDLKPSNVLVSTQDGVPVPKVIDFGIAKATQGRLMDQTVFTAFEQFLGTPAYMSPEQAQLGGLDVDTRSDIYSLGVLLYELLTGKTPFDTHAMLASGLDGMRRTIQEKEPSRPSTRLKTMALGELRTAADRRQVDGPKLIHLLRGDPDWIVMKCLEKDRARRYATANGLAHDIERHLDNEPIVARPPSRLYEFQKTVRRHKFGFAATAAIIAALCCGIVATTLQAVRARRLGNEAQAARRDATEKLWQSYLSEARALRLGGQAGRHLESLAVISKAAAIRPSLALRNEAIAAMILPDIRWLGQKDFSQSRDTVSLDSTFGRCAFRDKTGTVIVRRVADDREEVRLPGIGAAGTGASFSSKGKLLVVSYGNGHWCVWDWAKPTIVLEGEFGMGYAFDGDDRTFGVSDSTNIVLHDLVHGKQINRISLGGLGSSREPGLFVFDPAGQRLALFHTLAKTNVAILDTRKGETVQTLKHPAFVWSLAWHPDGKHLATGCADGNIRIWDSRSGEQVRMWRGDPVSVVFNHHGDMLASSYGWGGYTRLWEFGTGREQVGIYKSGNILGFSPDDQRLATAAWGGGTTLDFFEVGAGEGLRTLYEASLASGEGGFGPIVDRSGRLLAFRTHEGMRLLDFQTGRLAKPENDKDDKQIFGFDEDGQNLFYTGREGLFRCPITKPGVDGGRSIGNGALVSADPGGMGWISGNGKVCAIADGERGHFYRISTFEKQAETGLQHGIRYCDINWDGSLFANGIWQHPGVKVWNTQTGVLVRDLPSTTETATVAFSPDGRYLVIGSSDDYCFWEVASWSLVRRIPQEPDNDFSPMMAFSRDGRIFAGTHSRNKIRLHDATTGQVLADLAAPNSRMIHGLAFSHDGGQLAAAESWDALRLWDLRHIRRRLAELNLDWDLPPYPANDVPSDRTTGEPHDPIADDAGVLKR